MIQYPTEVQLELSMRHFSSYAPIHCSDHRHTILGLSGIIGILKCSRGFVMVVDICTTGTPSSFSVVCNYWDLEMIYSLIVAVDVCSTCAVFKDSS